MTSDIFVLDSVTNFQIQFQAEKPEARLGRATRRPSWTKSGTRSRLCWTRGRAGLVEGVQKLKEQKCRKSGVFRISFCVCFVHFITANKNVSNQFFIFLSSNLRI
jgi:hypothetical protein